MRNLFDQYSQPENRLTHALLIALEQDRVLLRAFLKYLKVKIPTKASSLQIEEQSIVGQPSYSEDEATKKGLPDGWLHDDENWCLLIESKVSSRLTLDQVKRHYRTAKRCGFTAIQVLSIEVIPSRIKQPEWLKRIKWRDVYLFLAKHRVNYWATQVLRFMEVAEIQFTESGYLKEGSLTVFSGIPFNQDNPYNYPEAKRVIKLLMEELRADSKACRTIGINPSLPGRGAITGKKMTAVWDFLSFKAASPDESFTKNPHFTIGIKQTVLTVSVTFPNRLQAGYRKNFKHLTYDGFYELVDQTTQNLTKICKVDPGFSPRCKAVQRRYPSQSAAPIHDAEIDFDLRTAVDVKDSKVKNQSQWLIAVYDAFINKHSNYQLQIGGNFEFEKSHKVQTEQVVKLIQQVWISCKPLLDAITK